MTPIPATKAPHLRSTETSKQLIVDGEPYLMLAAELQNSAMTSAEYMQEVWPKMVAGNINTVLGCVTWEMVEPEEGKFIFDELDKVIFDARKYGLRLILLWFGAFKNGVSSYAPAWVKTNAKRFPRAKLQKKDGSLETSDTLSIFHPATCEADSKAFSSLLTHLKEIDKDNSTVIMVQVENEVGLLGDSRDRSAGANERFAQQVPQDLVDFLKDDGESLHADLKVHLEHFFKNPSKTGSWEEVFGKSSRTDEIFMAYHYAKYVDQVAFTGRQVYEILLYTNVWMISVENEVPIIAGGGAQPGDYPCGGATSTVLDIWQKFAPTLDFIAPDVYLSDYDTSCADYRHRNQPLFIPEQRRDDYGARRIWMAYANYQALGVSPFGIDTLDPNTSPFTKVYGLLKSISAIVLKSQQQPGSALGFFFDEIPENGEDPSKPVIQQFGDYKVTIERSHVFGKPSPGGGMVIHLGGARFLLVGTGFQVHAQSISPTATYTGILRFEEKSVVNSKTGELKTFRVLNGDETRGGKFAVMPSEDPDYGGFPICITIPARTKIAEVEFYSLEE